MESRALRIALDEKKSFEERLQAVARLKDQGELARVVGRAHDIRLESEALERLDSEAGLLAAALQATTTMWDQTVINRLSEEASLIRVVHDAESERVKLAAAKKLRRLWNLEPVMDELVALAGDRDANGQVRVEAAILTGRQDLIDLACADAVIEAKADYHWRDVPNFRFPNRETLAALKDQDLLYEVAYRQGFAYIWEDAVSRLDAMRLERLVGDIPCNPDGTAKPEEGRMTSGEWEHFWKVVKAIARLGELAREGGIEARQALERLVTSDEHLRQEHFRKVCAELGHLTDSECSCCSRCGEAPCHVFAWVEEKDEKVEEEDEWVEQEDKPQVDVGKCRACGIIGRRWLEHCKTCDGTGISGYELVDHGSNSGASKDPIACPDCDGDGFVLRTVLTRD
jgi:hypothetical protein